MCLCNIYRHTCIRIALSGVVPLSKLWVCPGLSLTSQGDKNLSRAWKPEGQMIQIKCSYRHLYNCNNSPSPNVMQLHSTLEADALKVLEPSPQGHLRPVPAPSSFMLFNQSGTTSHLSHSGIWNRVTPNSKKMSTEDCTGLLCVPSEQIWFMLINMSGWTKSWQ